MTLPTWNPPSRAEQICALQARARYMIYAVQPCCSVRGTCLLHATLYRTARCMPRAVVMLYAAQPGGAFQAGDFDVLVVGGGATGSGTIPIASRSITLETPKNGSLDMRSQQTARLTGCILHAKSAFRTVSRGTVQVVCQAVAHAACRRRDGLRDAWAQDRDGGAR